MHHADKERKSLYICLAGCCCHDEDNQEFGTAPDYSRKKKNLKSGDNLDFELLNGSGIGRIVIGTPRAKNGGGQNR